MAHCQNCGQTNHPGTNFCRFCGTKIAPQYGAQSPVVPPIAPPTAPPVARQYPQPPNRTRTEFENAAPRPYSWKTDEYQVENDRETADRTRMLGQFQPPPPAAPLQTFHGHSPVATFQCPRCSANMLPRIERRISTAGWVLFAVLLATTFFFFWIGFLFKEEIRVCPVCNYRMP